MGEFFDQPVRMEEEDGPWPIKRPMSPKKPVPPQPKPPIKVEVPGQRFPFLNRPTDEPEYPAIASVYAAPIRFEASDVAHGRRAEAQLFNEFVALEAN